MDENDNLGSTEETVPEENWKSPSDGEITAPPFAFVGLFVIGKY